MMYIYLIFRPTFKKICKEKSTMGFECLPYIVALFSSTLWLYYAFLKGDALLLISINSFGFAIETVYITLYLVYASKNIRVRHPHISFLVTFNLLKVLIFK